MSIFWSECDDYNYVTSDALKHIEKGQRTNLNGVKKNINEKKKTKLKKYYNIALNNDVAIGHVYIL